MTDKQSERDHRQLHIDKVGVRGVRFPVQVRDKNHDSLQNTIATIGMYVDLPKEFKGTHMSRFVEILHSSRTHVSLASLTTILGDMKEILGAESSHIEITFPYFIEKKLYPNVDFYSGIILKALGIPTSMFTVIFAIGRTVGWIAHWNEMISGSYRIGRPRQLYTGYAERDFVPLEKR